MFDDYREGLRELKSRGSYSSYSYFSSADSTDDCHYYDSYNSGTGEYYDGCTTTKAEWIFLGIVVGGLVLFSSIYWVIRKCKNRRI